MDVVGIALFSVVVALGFILVALYTLWRLGVIALLNPMRKTLCPYCFNKFYIGSCPVVSNQGGTRTVMIAAPRGRFARVLSRVIIEPLRAGKYRRKEAARECPSCQKLLPYNIEETDNHVIALVGGPRSGKTHYIAALIDLVYEKAALAQFGCTKVIALDQTLENEYNRNYYEPLFHRHEIIEKTQTIALTGNKPLIYTLYFESKSWWRRTKGVNLVLFDAAGEDIQDTNRSMEFAPYIYNASAIIYLADPMGLPGLAGALPFDMRPSPSSQLERLPSYTLRWTLDTYNKYNGRGGNDRIRIPIVITLAKSDLLSYVPPTPGQPYPYSFLSVPNYAEGFDEIAFNNTSDEVKSIIRRFPDQNLFQAVSRLNNVVFCAVSATGSYPDPMTGRFPDVQPLRCLDPLLWIFAKLAIIKTKELPSTKRRRP